MPLVFSENLSDQFFIPKFIIFYLIALMLLFWGSITKRKLDTHCEKFIFYLFLAGTTIYFLSQFFYLGGSYRLVNYEIICFLIIIVYSLFVQSIDKKFLSKIAFANFLSLILIIIYVGFKHYTEAQSALDLFFGNRNHIAEFLGISVIIQFVFYKELNTTFKINGILLRLVAFTSIVICILTLCRSVILALVICGVSYVGKDYVLPWIKIKNLSKQSFIITLMLILSILVSSKYFYDLYSSSSNQTIAIKKLNTHLRLIRWENTLEMIKDHPLGVGPGNYEFAYIDYKSKINDDIELNESTLVKSPHNGYLELFVEYGVWVSVLFLIFMTIIFIKFWRNSNPIYYLMLLFISIDAIFAFPIELPFPSFAILFFIGAGLEAKSSKLVHLNLKIISRFILIPFLLSTVIVIFSLITSVVIHEKKINSELFCKLTPSVWRNCLDSARQELSKNNFHAANNILNEHLKLYPNNFIALRYNAFSLAKIGRVREACISLKRYDDLFLKKSSVKQLLIDQCSD